MIISTAFVPLDSVEASPMLNPCVFSVPVARNLLTFAAESKNDRIATRVVFTWFVPTVVSVWVVTMLVQPRRRSDKVTDKVNRRSSDILFAADVFGGFIVVAGEDEAEAGADGGDGGGEIHRGGVAAQNQFHRLQRGRGR